MSIRLKVAASSVRPLPKLEFGYCALCSADVSFKHYCWGCERYICIRCEKCSPEGSHKPEDHKHGPVRSLP